MMKKNLYIICLLFSCQLLAQKNDLQKCAETNFLHMDSVMNQGKDPFVEWHNCVVGKAVPEFALTDIAGRPVSSKTLQGKIMVIDFWIIDCLPCIAELPALNRLVKEYKDKGVEFIAITPEKQKRLDTDFFTKYKFDFSVVADASAAVELFGGSGYPKVFIVNQSGRIEETWLGGDTAAGEDNAIYKKTKTILDQLLEKGSSNK